MLVLIAFIYMAFVLNAERMLLATLRLCVHVLNYCHLLNGIYEDELCYASECDVRYST